jgi:hypothetical protein
VQKLVEQVKAGKVDRREFLLTATLLGLSASSAYGVLGLTEPFSKLERRPFKLVHGHRFRLLFLRACSPDQMIPSDRDLL